MLALSRKKNEALVINNNVEITVLEIKGEQVKLGISAPREVPVYRKEVHEQIQDANMEAVNVFSVGSFGSQTMEQAVTRADAAQMLEAAGVLLKGEEPKGLFGWLG